LQQIINDKEIVLTVITLENYFITWTLYSPSGANKSSRAKVVLFFVNDNFGVASSTIEYRNRCAQ
jgi:hypothetical protein